MGGNKIREKYLKFMEKRGHSVIPSYALMPENDPTTLFIGSGMQPLVPYLLGESHPKGTRLANSQKCFRAEDIEEVGDNRHTTFFEMLGNWSLGDYFKKEQLTWFFLFLVEEIGLNPEKIYVTAFSGDAKSNIPKDEESVIIWKELFNQKGINSGVADISPERNSGNQKMKDGERIFYYDANKNWWSRAGMPENMPTGEIGGPDSEIFYDFGTEHNSIYGKYCHPNCDCGRFLEIGNSVFMEYVKSEDGMFKKLPKQNVDFGGGLERITAAVNGNNDIFKTDLLWVVIKQIENLSGRRYEENLTAFRIITDHIRGAVFMIGDGIFPSNTEQGYFVRRLLRRSVRYADLLEIPQGKFKNLASSVIEVYKKYYKNLSDKQTEIIQTISNEEEQFRKTLDKGMFQLKKELAYNLDSGEAVLRKRISGESAFKLFTTYGFPIELTEEIALENNIKVDRKLFEKLMEEHRKKSRMGAEQKFKGGLADNSEKIVEYHTVTHLLLSGLRKKLGNHVHQAGSNITGERLRFDFTHSKKVDREILDKVEFFVNNAIKSKAIVSVEVMDKDIAKTKKSIEGSFWDRYPDKVKVYTIKNSDGFIYSKELCGGPHVENTNKITGAFKIKKESSSSAGIRRIKAVLEL